MVSFEPGASSAGTGPRAARAADRVYAARYLLWAVAALLLLGVGTFELPPLFAIGAIIALVIVAALPSQRQSATAGDNTARSALIWPDTAMKATVEAMPKPAFV